MLCFQSFLGLGMSGIMHSAAYYWYRFFIQRLQTLFISSHFLRFLTILKFFIEHFYIYSGHSGKYPSEIENLFSITTQLVFLLKGSG